MKRKEMTYSELVHHVEEFKSDVGFDCTRFDLVRYIVTVYGALSFYHFDLIQQVYRAGLISD